VAGGLIQGHKLLHDDAQGKCRTLATNDYASFDDYASLNDPRLSLTTTNQFEFSQSVGFKSFTIQRETSGTCEIQRFIY
jgi:hypothetical protein